MLNVYELDDCAISVSAEHMLQLRGFGMILSAGWMSSNIAMSLSSTRCSLKMGQHI